MWILVQVRCCCAVDGTVYLRCHTTHVEAFVEISGDGIIVTSISKPDEIHCVDEINVR